MTVQKVYTVKCQHEGCQSDHTEQWSIPGYDPEPVFFYCFEHAADAGFCLTCGAFIGGTEDIFLTGQEGLCFECFRDLDAEAVGSDYDEDEDQ